jgi:hypothetical protein
MPRDYSVEFRVKEPVTLSTEGYDHVLQGKGLLALHSRALASLFRVMCWARTPGYLNTTF